MSDINTDVKISDIAKECDYRHGNCETTFPCIHKDICKKLKNEMPFTWMKPDPPRFNEAQMAFLKGCYEIGIVGIMRSGDGSRTHFFTKYETIGWLKNSEIPLELGETLDLVELFGKESNEK